LSSTQPIQLVVLDMAGTTVVDDGAVEAAFVHAAAEVGVTGDSPRLPGMLDYVRATMGESKIVVFRHLLDDEDLAQRANLAFERSYSDHLAGGDCRAIDGAEQAIDELRQAGVKVALTTGFSPSTQKAIIDALGWADHVDLWLAPADAGRGRPYPDMPLTALLRLAVDDVRAMAVAGDTSADITSGLRSGASIVAGVLTGAHDEAKLRDAGATHVLGSVVDLARLILS
jgi:phosphonatase-like hydrolase